MQRGDRLHFPRKPPFRNTRNTTGRLHRRHTLGGDTHTHTHTKMRKKQVDELWPTTRTQTNYPPAINKLLCPAFTSLHRSQFRFFNFTFINRIFHTTMKGKRASILEEAAASLNKISQNLHECTMKRHKTLWSATISMRSESSPVDSSFVYLRCYTSMLICFCT